MNTYADKCANIYKDKFMWFPFLNRIVLCLDNITILSGDKYYYKKKTHMEYSKEVILLK